MRFAVLGYAEFHADDLHHAMAIVAHHFAARSENGVGSCSEVDGTTLVVVETSRIPDHIRAEIPGLISDAELWGP